MGTPAKFQIDLDKKFPTLAKPPIVEAAIYWNGETTQTTSPASIAGELMSKFPGYVSSTYFPPPNDPISIDLKKPPSDSPDQFRLLLSLTEDGRVGLFQSEGATFSQLKPYPGWDMFLTEGMRFWQAYSDILAPQSLDTLGLRFTSQIEVTSGERIEELIKNVSHPLIEIGLSQENFFHRESAILPQNPFRVDLSITMQTTPQTTQQFLLVDIDVQATQSIPNEMKQIHLRLAEMRYIKNAVFFGCIRNPEVRFGTR
ncbi:TIGR04255 family protein [Blastopirellula marina]|uniref:TIGR04255 family protein n=1 Tax=Blastopirellula marina DSM 3645 TaxID=314230 RepID=A3ZNU4_9BACT|nr:TIGR04255 family protein [Blastopirellula marina]EAQ81992.1 hypothetical protein DSM3645_17610 [Blastopirellula marina DSM 3645]